MAYTEIKIRRAQTDHDLAMIYDRTIPVFNRERIFKGRGCNYFLPT